MPPLQHHRCARLALHTISVDATYTHSAAPNYMEMHQLTVCAILIRKTNPDHQFYSRLSEPRSYAEDKGQKKNLSEPTAHPAHGQSLHYPRQHDNCPHSRPCPITCPLHRIHAFSPIIVIWSNWILAVPFTGFTDSVDLVSNFTALPATTNEKSN